MSLEDAVPGALVAAAAFPPPRAALPPPADRALSAPGLSPERMSSLLFGAIFASFLSGVRMSSFLPPASPPGARISSDDAAPGILVVALAFPLSLIDGFDTFARSTIVFTGGLKSRVGSLRSCRSRSSCKSGNQS